MSDDFDTDRIKHNLKQQDTWLRLLFIVIYGAVLWVTSIVLGFVVVLQFLNVLFTGQTQPNLLKFGGSLAEFVRQIVAYLTFNSEYKPFPFGDWPTAAAAAAAEEAAAPKRRSRRKPPEDPTPEL
ncbi:MAG TPA: DUF4389 domain-containing protein [Gammaproteobacteria bacterium]|nr:DUF4389 domain-containing protein [Gammaproteobacteria bacterium]